MKLAQKKENLSDVELVQKSRELDELLNCFYASGRNGKQGQTAHIRRTIEKTAAARCKKGLMDKNQPLKLKRLCRRLGKKYPPFFLVC